MKLKKILISQPEPADLEKSPYKNLTDKYGVELTFYKFFEVVGISASEFRKSRIRLSDYTAVIFSSKNSIDHFFRICEEMRIQVPESMHYYCISETVACYLQKHIQYRKRKVFFAEHNKFEELLPTMKRRPNEKYMMVMSDIHNDNVINMFAAKDIHITPAVMYRTVPSEWPKDKPFDHDMIVLFTPTGAAALKQNFPDLKPGEKIIACFGQNTAAALEEAGLPADIKTPTPDCPSITTAIHDYLEAHLS